MTLKEQLENMGHSVEFRPHADGGVVCLHSYDGHFVVNRGKDENEAVELAFMRNRHALELQKPGAVLVRATDDYDDLIKKGKIYLRTNVAVKVIANNIETIQNQFNYTGLKGSTCAIPVNIFEPVD